MTTYTIGNRRGFSLIELLVAIAVVGIIVAVAGFQFAGWQRKYNKENQIKTLYADLMAARTEAKARNRQVLVAFSNGTPKQYTVTEDTNNNGTNAATYPDAADRTLDALSKDYDTVGSKDYTKFAKKFRYDSVDDPMIVIFNKRGLAELPADVVAGDDVLTIGLERYYGPEREDPEYDCINIQSTRMKLGKYDNADNCVER